MTKEDKKKLDAIDWEAEISNDVERNWDKLVDSYFNNGVIFECTCFDCRLRRAGFVVMVGSSGGGVYHKSDMSKLLFRVSE